MKKIVIIALACVIGLELTVTTVNASALVVGDEFYIGSYSPPTANSDADNLNYLINLITLDQGATDQLIGTTTYNREGSTVDEGGLPDPTLPGVNPPNSTFDVSPFTYIVGRYDGANGYGLVWYAGEDLLDNVSLPTRYNGKTLNQITWYSAVPTNGVPDGGMTLMLLGGALVCLEALRRRSKA